MQVCATIAEAREALQGVERPLGAVLTMGALHAGHLALVRRAKAECKTVAATIYVNPTQFGDARDLEAYPRAVQDDLRVLQREGVDVVVVPSDAEMYPEGFGNWVEPGEIAARLEGEHRPGHFRGVCTVVLKLFNILCADRSYFGQKDAQQALVIRKMAADLGLPVEIVTVPTVRERDGLAMSSRNGNLSREERKAARVLSRALTVALEMAAEGELDAAASATPCESASRRSRWRTSTTPASPTRSRSWSWTRWRGLRSRRWPSALGRRGSSTTSRCWGRTSRRPSQRPPNARRCCGGRHLRGCLRPDGGGAGFRGGSAVAQSHDGFMSFQAAFPVVLAGERPPKK